MAKKYRIGIIGFGHMHINDVAAHYVQHPQAELAAVADTIPDVPELRVAPYTREWNLQFALENLGFKKSYADYREMLAKEDLDIAIITSENSKHAEVVEACAAAGTHVCVEKPMSHSFSDALRMVRACQAHNTTLVVNWPLTWSPQARRMKSLIEEGAIGRVLEVKWRSGHTGPLGPGAAHAGVSESAAPMSGPERAATWWHQSSKGGGATLDYCCYGAMVSHWYIGEEGVAAVGMKANLDSQWGDADDNGAMIIRFPSAMAVLEGSWTQRDYGVPGGPIIYGTTGTLLPEGHERSVRLGRGHGNDTFYEADPLPQGRHDIAYEYIHHLETGEPLHPTLEMMFNLRSMAILDAGIRSSNSGKLEMVDNSTWRIG